MLHPLVRMLSTEQWMIVLSAGTWVCAVPRLKRNAPDAWSERRRDHCSWLTRRRRSPRQTVHADPNLPACAKHGPSGSTETLPDRWRSEPSTRMAVARREEALGGKATGRETGRLRWGGPPESR